MTESDRGATPEPAKSEASATCPWCAAAAAPGARRCAACGAALAQRESLGDVQIPGVTSVDPALVDFDNRPLRLRGPSPSQGIASSLIVGTVAGGPIGLVAIGGVAAVAGAEFLATRHGGPDGVALEDVGKPSEVALQALEHLEDDPAGSPAAAAGDLAAADGGQSIWRDLPPEADEP